MFKLAVPSFLMGPKIHHTLIIYWLKCCPNLQPSMNWNSRKLLKPPSFLWKLNFLLKCPHLHFDGVWYISDGPQNSSNFNYLLIKILPNFQPSSFLWKLSCRNALSCALNEYDILSLPYPPKHTHTHKNLSCVNILLLGCEIHPRVNCYDLNPPLPSWK